MRGTGVADISLAPEAYQRGVAREDNAGDEWRGRKHRERLLSFGQRLTISGVPSGFGGGTFWRARRGTSSGFSGCPALTDDPPPAEGAIVWPSSFIFSFKFSGMCFSLNVFSLLNMVKPCCGRRRQEAEGGAVALLDAPELMTRVTRAMLDTSHVHEDGDDETCDGIRWTACSKFDSGVGSSVLYSSHHPRG